MHIKDTEGWEKSDASSSKNLSNAFIRVSQLHNKKLEEEYNGIDFGSKKYEEKADILSKIAICGGYPEIHNKKIVKNIIDTIHL